MYSVLYFRTSLFLIAGNSATVQTARRPDVHNKLDRQRENAVVVIKGQEKNQKRQENVVSCRLLQHQENVVSNAYCGCKYLTAKSEKEYVWLLYHRLIELNL